MISTVLIVSLGASNEFCRASVTVCRALRPFFLAFYMGLSQNQQILPRGVFVFLLGPFCCFRAV